jgi:hypothetical protein
VDGSKNKQSEGSFIAFSNKTSGNHKEVALPSLVSLLI